jgi:hypothetical protein
LSQKDVFHVPDPAKHIDCRRHPDRPERAAGGSAHPDAGCPYHQRGTGNGAFASTPTSLAIETAGVNVVQHIEAADLNQDGYADLVTTRSDGRTSVSFGSAKTVTLTLANAAATPKVTVFNFSGDTYLVLDQSNASTFASGDLAIKLTGVQTVSFSDLAFVKM